MFTDVAPFTDNNVRLALKYAIDRKALVQTILRGHGRPANDSPITPANHYFAADIPVREYDPEKAKFHLKQAGLSSPQGRPLSGRRRLRRRGGHGRCSSRSRRPRPASTSMSCASPMTATGRISGPRSRSSCASGLGAPPRTGCFSQVYAKEAPWNDTPWKNERFNQLLVEARAELTADKRRALYHEMQLLLQRRGRRHHSDVRQLRQRAVDEDRPRRDGRLQLRARRLEVHRAVVDGLEPFGLAAVVSSVAACHRANRRASPATEETSASV